MRTINTKQRSRFICLQCECENHVGEYIQRPIQREKYHIKDLYCIYCKDTTKNIEVRSCDTYEKVQAQIPYLQRKLKIKPKINACTQQVVHV